MVLVSTIRVDHTGFVRYETLRCDCCLGITPTLLAMDLDVCQSLGKFLACFNCIRFAGTALLVLSYKVSFPQLMSKMMSVLPLLDLEK